LKIYSGVEEVFYVLHLDESIKAHAGFFIPSCLSALRSDREIKFFISFGQPGKVEKIFSERKNPLIMPLMPREARKNFPLPLLARSTLFQKEVKVMMNRIKQNFSYASYGRYCMFPRRGEMQLYFSICRLINLCTAQMDEWNKK
jgi:hypothetical protein